MSPKARYLKPTSQMVIRRTVIAPVELYLATALKGRVVSRQDMGKQANSRSSSPHFQSVNSWIPEGFGCPQSVQVMNGVFDSIASKGNISDSICNLGSQLLLFLVTPVDVPISPTK
ncbi:hypothetical protein UY3_04779 [Chelonia mydas]|uniref:Uncharacterized protein n=1 Tax=Chelonia mydas TaxID=8469 RepID=M7BQM9_CHEMY|nr:hypothetical protein UY3_04779 [Chelonia mydas]